MATQMVELHKLKLAGLKQECLARGLETKGIKQDFINRLQAYLRRMIHAQKDDYAERCREERAVYKPRREAWNRTFPCSSQKEPTLPAP
uniref:SAP domain-containing ribonucleoprotein n=1 Tax=Piliocolobus tephrosceles TaxID=591936 RepID=A0A8C9IQ54_9PRIM